MKRYAKMPRTSTDLRKKRSYNILIYEDDFEVLYKMAVDRTRKGGGEINKLLEKGSAFYAPAASAVMMAESYIKDLKKTLPCATYLNGEYGVKDIYAGVPIVIGKNGVEKIVELSLDKVEKINFDKSIKAVKELFEIATKIDSNLKK